MSTVKEFLILALGERGANVLEKYASKNESISGIIVPRVIVSWLLNSDSIKEADFNLSKSEGKFTGKVAGIELKDASLFETASTVAHHVSLENKQIDEPVNIETLGKNIDLLILAKIKAKKEESKEESKVVEKIELAGPPADKKKPEPPIKPLIPVSPSMGRGKTKGQKIVSITKSELMARCPTCGQKEFESNRFVGCSCFKDLAKNAKLNIKNSDKGYNLKFGSGWDVESMAALLSIVKP